MTIKPGDKIDLEINQGTAATKICQDIAAGASGRMLMRVNRTLCVEPAPSSAEAGGNGATGTGGTVNHTL